MVEENEEGKTCLIKITRNSGTRQVINYALSKIKADFKVEMNAFSLDMSKAIEATEIMKTRAPFLHQETKLIQSTKTTENKSTNAEGNEEVSKVTKTYSGISITLSRNAFEISDLAGY
jgi:hypothetical protein